MSELYMRHVELFVDELLFFGRDLTINFDVPFSDSEDENVAEIKIFNLSDGTIARIKEGDKKIILNAGYVGDAGAILLGIAKDMKTEWSGVDRITTLQVLDGNDSWFSMPYSKTFNEGVDADTILGAILAETGLQIGAYSLPDNYVYRSGKTVKGTLANVIKGIAKDCGAKAHVTRGKIFIRPKDEGDDIGFRISAETGLISSPTPLETEVEEKDAKGKSIKDDDGKAKKAKRWGWRVVMLLNHRITTDALVEITSKTANGFFRVESGKHTSNGQTYYTELDVYPI